MPYSKQPRRPRRESDSSAALGIALLYLLALALIIGAFVIA